MNATARVTRSEIDRAERDACRAASEDLRGPAARAEQAERVSFALVRSARAGLDDATRDLRSERITEAEIHAVIPFRPRTREEEDAAPPGPTGPSAPRPADSTRRHRPNEGRVAAPPRGAALRSCAPEVGRTLWSSADRARDARTSIGARC